MDNICGRKLALWTIAKHGVKQKQAEHTMAKMMQASSNPLFRTKANRVNNRSKTVVPAMAVNDNVMAFTRWPAGDAMSKEKRNSYNTKFTEKTTEEPALRIVGGEKEESKETYNGKLS